MPLNPAPARVRKPRAPPLRAVEEGEQPADWSEFREVEGRYVYALPGRKQMVLSNWSATPVEVLRYPQHGEVLRLRAALVGRSPIWWTLPRSALDSVKELISSLPGPEWAWAGDGKHLAMLRNHWGQAPYREVKATAVMGRHGNMLLLPSGVYGPEGPRKKASLRYAIPPSECPEMHLYHEVLKTQGWPEPEDHERAKKALLEVVPYINTPDVMIHLLGWLGALPWALGFRESRSWGGFPHLLVWGSTGAGKTSTVKVLMRLCGVPFSVGSQNLPQTAFTRLVLLSGTNLVPIWFDEYRPTSWHPQEASRFHMELRNGYGATQESRGARNLKVHSYRLTAPVVVSGEVLVHDIALRERLICVCPSATVLDGTPNPYRDRYYSLEEEPLEAFALPYWCWALQQKGWAQVAYNIREAYIRQYLAGVPQVRLRVQNNMAIVAFGLEMLRRYLDGTVFAWAGVSYEGLFQAYAANHQTGQRRNALDELMVFANAYINRLERGVHWDVKQGHLVLRLEQLVATLTAIQRQTGWGSELLPIESYRRLVQEERLRRVSYVLPAERRKSRAHMLDRLVRVLPVDPIRLLARTGVDVEDWLRISPRHTDAEVAARIAELRARAHEKRKQRSRDRQDTKETKKHGG